MIRHVFIFLGTFVAGAVVALVVRAAAFKPHAGHEPQATTGGDYAPMVSNPLTPAKSASSPATAPAPASPPKPAATDPHAGHGSVSSEPQAKPTAATASNPAQPVNTVCAICGMPVDPKLPTAQYQGKTIGFGCRMCPPKFKAEPDRYGPHYLRNEVATR